MDQFDQLLTCAICLDRYRNPKLLPCQHSFCMEPCMEGLVDYVRRQVKCPECRAEHRIPYQGVQAFPTNVTLQRFLELHIDITGEIPDPTTNQIMERCQVCSEKAYLLTCAHCEKKVCTECKDAHMDVLKREISRIGHQVRRVLHRLEDASSLAEKNSLLLQQNSLSVIEEIDDIYRRLAKALKDRCEQMKHEVERYLQTELKNLQLFKYNIEQELGNISSNCDLVDKYMNVETGNFICSWEDCELMDTKEIFLKTMEFIRSFEYEPGDYARRVRFLTSTDPNTLAVTLATFGDLHLPPMNPNAWNSCLTSGIGSLNQLTPSHPAGPSSSGLMRSKSDHRLTSQFRGQDPYNDEPISGGRTSPVFGTSSGRKFGERSKERYHGNSGIDLGLEPGMMEFPLPERKSRFRSRFTRHLVDSFDDQSADSSRGVRFNENEERAGVRSRERVLDTEDVARGPLSGITRLLDSPRVIQKVQESETGPKPPKVPPTPLTVNNSSAVVPSEPKPPAPWRGTSRQMSEEDEITKQKKANKMEAAAAATSATTNPKSQTPNNVTSPPARNRQTSTEPGNNKQDPRTRTTSESALGPETSTLDSSSSSAPPVNESTTTTSQQLAANETSTKIPRKLSPERYPKNTRSESSDSGTSETNSSASSSARNTGGGGGTTGQVTTTNSSPVKPITSGRPPAQQQQQQSSFQSRFLGRNPTPTATAVETKEEESAESSSSSEEETETESDDEDAPTPVVESTKSKTPERLSKMEKTDIGPLLARSAIERQRNTLSRENSSASSTSAYKEPPTSVASYRRTRADVSRVTSPPEREIGSRYTSGSGSSGTAPGVGNTNSASNYGRYNSSRSGSGDYGTGGGLSRSRSTVYSPPEESSVSSSTPSSRYSSGLTSKYLNRSRHAFDDDNHGHTTTTTPRYGTTSAASSYGHSHRPSYLSKRY